MKTAKTDPRQLNSRAQRGSMSRFPAETVLGFALTWCVLITGLVSLQLYLIGQAFSERTLAVVFMFVAGSFLGGLFACAFAWLITRWHNQPSARFAAMFIGLSCGTVGMTALIHYLHFRSYFADEHSPVFTIYWVFETLMTGASSAYIFTVEGMQLLLPWGLPLLFAAAWDYARSGNTRR
ncbi:hypothetical protein [Roseibium algae]|uniref:Uncharacterized protein n=1 Tax=Roseibium algae TaxID=3123038 RepID=A0ABU8TMT3_9HYPH